VYRVVRRKYADLSGEGARRVGGRFNPPGIAAVYTSESIALGVLEVLVHLDRSELPSDYVVIAISFDGRKIGRRLLSAELVNRGSPELYRSNFYSSTVHRVSSVLVPRESNYVLLPDAPGFGARVEWIEPLRFDERLFGPD
jgi:RES domain-containing protein